MASTLEDLVNEIENEELEKQASEVDEVDGLAEEVMRRAMEKVAKAKTKPKAEKDPEEMLDETEDEEVEEIEEELEKEAEKDEDDDDDGDEESKAEEAIEEEVEEELRGEEIEKALSKKQKEKVASISENFSSPVKKKLFEKIASFQLLNNPRVVIDNNFQKYETLDGLPKEIKMLFDDKGEEVNNI